MTGEKRVKMQMQLLDVDGSSGPSLTIDEVL